MESNFFSKQVVFYTLWRSQYDLMASQMYEGHSKSFDTVVAINVVGLLIELY